MIKVADMGDRDDERFVLDLLEASNVLVVQVGFRERSSAGYFRMVYLAGEELLDPHLTPLNEHYRYRCGNHGLHRSIR